MHEIDEVFACSGPMKTLDAWFRVLLPKPCEGAVRRRESSCVPNIDLPLMTALAIGLPMRVTRGAGGGWTSVACAGMCVQDLSKRSSRSTLGVAKARVLKQQQQNMQQTCKFPLLLNAQQRSTSCADARSVIHRNHHFASRSSIASKARLHIMRIATILLLSASSLASAFLVSPALVHRAPHKKLVVRMDGEANLQETRYLWGDYEDGRDPLRDVLQLLDVWDEDQDGGAEVRILYFGLECHAQPSSALSLSCAQALSVRLPRAHRRCCACG